MIAIELCERGWVPDALMRAGIRALLRRRLREETRGAGVRGPGYLQALAEGPIAEHTREANEQHYELPAAFYEQVLGEHCKYSAAYWPPGVRTLDAAEASMLELCCERAGIADGMRVLDLGCGWGALSLWIAARFPASRVLAMSNSHSQRRFIEARAAARGLVNLEVVTADVNSFRPQGQFDRIVSVEMFEHLRNYDALLSRIAEWLRADGRLFVHVFCHRELLYPFEVRGESDWMSRHFFTGGIMPAEHTLNHFQRALSVQQQWRVDGRHYARTARAWLERLDERRERVMPVLAGCYGEEHAERWFHRWRMFFTACAELFGYRDGSEWFVAHYLFARKPAD